MASNSRDPKRAAQKAGLRYVSDTGDGIHRLGRAGHFRYQDGNGRPVRNRQILKRIGHLVIPPAWTDVWIAPSDNAHLQATGRDAKGRKQYRYHAGFAAVRDASKYDHLAEFAAALPALRRRLKQDLGRPALSREKVLAAIIILLEETLIRVGNEDYARKNDSFGLTTLRNRHVKVKGSELRFLFKGKSGKQWALAIHDKRVAKVVRNCQDLPGQHLFEYRDADGHCHVVSSHDVNAYLRDVTGRDITAKDFRTWAGTVHAAILFDRTDAAPTKKSVRDVVSAVAAELGNTVAVCRKCYIHPGVVTAFEGGKLALRIPAKGRDGLLATEIAVRNFLQKSRSRS